MEEPIKKRASAVCMMAFAWHIGVQPSLAAGTEPPRLPAERPIAAAIAAAGPAYGHLLSQAGTNRMSGSRQAKIALAAAIGFGVGYGIYYFKEKPLDFADDRAHALAAGSYGAMMGGAIAYWVTGP